MKILFVFPPILGEERYGKLAGAGSYLPPLGLLYLAAVLKDRHEVKIIDGGVRNIVVEDIGREIEKWKPQILGVSTITHSACPEETMQNEYVDIVVKGEGEITFNLIPDLFENNYWPISIDP